MYITPVQLVKSIVILLQQFVFTIIVIHVLQINDILCGGREEGEDAVGTVKRGGDAMRAVKRVGRRCGDRGKGGAETPWGGGFTRPQEMFGL